MSRRARRLNVAAPGDARSRCGREQPRQAAHRRRARDAHQLRAPPRPARHHRPAGRAHSPRSPPRSPVAERAHPSADDRQRRRHPPRRSSRGERPRAARGERRRSPRSATRPHAARTRARPASREDRRGAEAAARAGPYTGRGGAASRALAASSGERPGVDPMTVAGTRRDLVRTLRDVRATDVRLAGGKGANLGELVSAGFPVPEGFVLGTDAYVLAAAQAGVDPHDPKSARDRILAARIPDELTGAVVDAYRAMGAPRVAVRSSATAEDLPEASFAGQQDTILGVGGEDALLDAVRRCWASLWNERAVAYRRM